MSQTNRPVYGEVPRYGLYQPAPTSPLPPAPRPLSDRSGPDRLGELAGWPSRVAAYLIDFAPAILAAGVFGYGYARFLLAVASRDAGGLPTPVPGLGWMAGGGTAQLLLVGWQAYNRWYLGGRTGQSLGKRVLGLRLVAEATGAPIGAGFALLRDVVHILDGVAYVGFLWPLWDERHQTFADKIMRTVVHRTGHDRPTPSPPVTG